mgnify:CR=1 FL=1
MQVERLRAFLSYVPLKNNSFKVQNITYLLTCAYELNIPYAKGQLISKCLLGVIVSTKKPTKFF